MISFRSFLPAIVFIVLLSPASSHASHEVGEVVDAFTGKPIAGAILTSGQETYVTDSLGRFKLRPCSRKLLVRALGYLRAEYGIPCPKKISLRPFTPKALYLTMYGIAVQKLREPALRLIRETELNAVVIDVKGDRGYITYRSHIPQATAIGAQRVIAVKDIKAVLSSLKAQGIYTIARIVVFKDNILASYDPSLAVRTSAGTMWKDGEGLAWADPFKKEVWDYNIAIAIEAAIYGFDEIQFDYVRFPDKPGLAFSAPSTQASRMAAINGFLSEARESLKPYNVFLTADIFGYVLWNTNDTDIGQRLEEISQTVDIMCPMLYPSGFQYGIPGYRMPVAHPYQILRLSLENAKKRTGASPLKFRPWIQAFRDYAFDGRRFGAEAISAQIKASEDAGANGWMLWNPENVYSSGGLKPEQTTYSLPRGPE